MTETQHPMVARRAEMEAAITYRPSLADWALSQNHGEPVLNAEHSGYTVSVFVALGSSYWSWAGTGRGQATGMSDPVPDLETVMLCAEMWLSEQLAA